MWAVALVVFVICASLSALLTVGADEPVDAVVEAVETAVEAPLVEDYNEFLDSYSDNVGTEGFDEKLEYALGEKRNDVKPYATWLALLPPIIAIALALITKEVYSSLFIGILSGALLYSNFSFTGTIDHAFQNGFIASVADSYNIGIIIFLIILGAIVCLMNQSGGSAAFGRWATKHIKSKVGAQCATIFLGILIFVDDYFNCLTVGSVMRPVTDKFKVSRAKLAYLIDATAAPVCIIAPISSWAAAVAGFVSEEEISGFGLFLRAIPYNFYAILTIVMMFCLVLLKFEFGPMKKHELNAENGDLFSSADAELFKALEDADENKKGIVWDLIAPVLVLIVACILGLLYSGGFFTPDSDVYMNLIDAFSSADASVGLVLGSFAGLIFSVIYFMCRRVLTFKKCMEAIPEGFKAMVPAIMILACAWTLKTMTDSLGAKIFIAEFVRNYAQAAVNFLPAIVFLIAVGLSFATGTSWGTFGILIPIVLAVFGGTIEQEICIIAISACMAGAVCGDHCSPISDTTIMASAGSQSNHLNHVSTQLPYALTGAAVSFVCYLIAGFVQNWYIMLPLSIVIMIATMFAVKMATAKKA
ncbi:MAG: Na+/H+ antiporter NhaC family protein [Clostridia bacterium]|nr:Na+/H+ antiporter NhaC family protein [Clostridia bacterium]